MGERYIKTENGREVVYEKSSFGDYKIGELEEDSLSPSKSSGESLFDSRLKNISVEDPSLLSNERRASIEGVSGVFRKGSLDRYPIFRPDAQSIERIDSESEDRNYEVGNYSPSYSVSPSPNREGKGVSLTKILVGGALVIGGLALIAAATSKKDSDK